MRIVIGSDHGGLELKVAVKELLLKRGLEVEDLKVAGTVSQGDADCGILVCGTGIGMSIVANKFPRVRAALVTDEFMALMAKEHNNANILVLGGRVLTIDLACRMVETWLDAAYEGGRHQRRLDKIAGIEEDVQAGRI
jgi:ribose 5-phosphate isomerase B